jgi:hypothetical protein
MSRCRPDVRAFALFADETQELDGTSAGGPEPVRSARVELCGLPGLEDEVVFREYKAERSVEDIDPVVTLVGAQVGLGVVASGREDELVGLDSSGPTGQRQDDRAVAAGNGTQIDAWVAGRRRIDELVECDPVGPSKRKQLLERGTSQARLEPGQSTGGDACLLREVGERNVAMQTKAFQPRSDGVKSAVNGFIHPSILPFGNNVCVSAFSLGTVKNEPRNAPAEGVHDPSRG